MSTGQTVDTILHDVIAFGVVAASIFVKNPASQQHAVTIIQAIQPLLAMIDNQLVPATTAATTTAPAVTPAIVGA